MHYSFNEKEVLQSLPLETVQHRFLLDFHDLFYGFMSQNALEVGFAWKL